MAIDTDLTCNDPLVEPVDLRMLREHSTPEGSAFPPISDYGFLSDQVVTALVASSGSIEWMCLPRMDSPSIFGTILDRGAGSFRLGPADVLVPARVAAARRVAVVSALRQRPPLHRMRTP